MQSLQGARDLAEARGYLCCPEVLALQDRAPGWFRALGSEAGLADFEARRGIRVPAALREFYGCLPLACFLEASIDGEVFLADLATLTDAAPPPLVTWSAGPHLVFAFPGHSGMICAAELGADDPRVFWGFDGDPEPYQNDDQPPVSFSEWVFGVVDRHEDQLDYWQAVYLKCQADPDEARRLGGVEWIRSLPGMAGRLRRPDRTSDPARGQGGVPDVNISG
jgi:hypothetical protein